MAPPARLADVCTGFVSPEDSRAGRNEDVLRPLCEYTGLVTRN